MSDQCKHCEYRGNFKDCAAADCFKHEDWIAEQHRTRYSKLQAEATLLREALNKHQKNFEYWKCERPSEFIFSEWMRDNEQALSATPETAKVAKVLEAAKEEEDNHKRDKHSGEPCHFCDCDLCEAVRKWQGHNGN